MTAEPLEIKGDGCMSCDEGRRCFYYWRQTRTTRNGTIVRKDNLKNEAEKCIDRC